MQIGINLLYLQPKEAAGLFIYGMGLLSGLKQLSSNNEIVLFTSKETGYFLKSKGFDFKQYCLDFDPRRRLHKIIIEQLVLPRIVSNSGIDLLHSLAYIAPLKLSVPSVLTIPDANAYFAPQSLSVVGRLVWRILVPQAAKHASAIITISESAKRDLIMALNIPHPKVSVTYLAPRIDLQQTNYERIQKILKKYDLPTSYILSVSSLYPHKNLQTLLNAYSLLLLDTSSLHWPDLVLVGSQRRSLVALKEQAQELRILSRVIFAGFVDHGDISSLYAGADLFVFPSLHEGFGMPILEAMMQGTPVISSRSSSLPEVGGNAAYYVEGTSATLMSKAMIAVLRDNNEQMRLRKLGFKNVERFSWVKTAEATELVYRQVIKGDQ